MKELVVKNPGDKLFSDDWNNAAQELNNVIKAGNITQSGADLEQVAKSISNHVASADYYTDTGSSTAYVLSPQSPKKAPTILDEGMRVRFIPANTNTASATVNINSLGVKNIKTANGQDLEAGDIEVGRAIELAYDGTDFLLANDARSINYLPLANDISGLNISNNTTDANNDIDIEPGTFVDSVNFNAWRLVTTLVKQIDNDWVEGTDLGGFPSGLTLTADTWYHVFTIAKSDGTVDGGFDSSLTATNLLADASTYTYYKRIGSVYYETGAPNHIRKFFKFGNKTVWDSAFVDSTTITPAGTWKAFTLLTPPNVNTAASIAIGSVTTGVAGIQIKSTFVSGGVEVLWSSSTVDGRSGYCDIVTDTNSQIDVKATLLVPSSSNVETVGWSEL